MYSSTFFFFFYHVARWGWVVNATTRPLYPLYRRLRGSQGWSERLRKTLPTPEYDPRNVQPVASGYKDDAMLARDMK